MPGLESITGWIDGIKGGDEESARQLWMRYYDAVLQVARRKLGQCRGFDDEEDVAQSVFHSVFRGAAADAFECLEHREDLWQLLLVLTTRKAISHVRRELRDKRGGGSVRGDSVFMNSGDDQPGFEQVPGFENSPVVQAILNEEHARLLGMLRDDSLRQVAQGKLEGRTNSEIAEQLGISVHSVGRKLKLIRSTWILEIEP